MKKNTETRESSKVSEVTRDTIVNAAEHVEILKKKAGELTKAAEKKWEESKPRQQKAKDDVKKAAQKVVDFGKDVREGVREGFSEVQKKKQETIPASKEEDEGSGLLNS